MIPMYLLGALVLAALTAVVAIPRVGYERQRRRPSRA